MNGWFSLGGSANSLIFLTAQPLAKHCLLLVFSDHYTLDIILVMKVVRHQNRLPRAVVEVSCLEVFKAKLHEALSNLV